MGVESSKIPRHCPRRCGKKEETPRQCFQSPRAGSHFEGSSDRAYIDNSIAPEPVELYSQILDTTPQKRVLVCWEQSAPASPTKAQIPAPFFTFAGDGSVQAWKGSRKSCVGHGRTRFALRSPSAVLLFGFIAPAASGALARARRVRLYAIDRDGRRTLAERSLRRTNPVVCLIRGNVLNKRLSPAGLGAFVDHCGIRTHDRTRYDDFDHCSRI